MTDNTHTYHWSDLFVGHVRLGGPVPRVLGVPNAVDLLVDLRPVMVANLAGPGNGELDSAGMPRPDAGHFPQALVCLARKLLGVPAEGNTCATQRANSTSETTYNSRQRHENEVNAQQLKCTMWKTTLTLQDHLLFQ